MGKARWWLYVLVLVVLVVPANWAAAATPVAAPAAPQGTLYLPVFDTDATRLQYNVVSVDLATGERTIVLSNASQSSVSHDGKAIAYKLWIQDQTKGGLHSAMLSDIRGTDWRFGTSIADQRPQWAPNDSLFAFYSRSESDRLNRVMVTQGAAAIQIPRPDLNDKAIIGKSSALTTVGGRFAVLYQGCEYTKCGVWQRFIDGTAPVQITQGTSDQALAPSPDGKSIAFMAYDRDDAKDWEIYVMAPDGTNVKRLTNRPGSDGLPTWSADGKWIAFVREVTPGSNNWDVMAIQPDGTGEKKLATLGALDGKVGGTTPDQSQGWLEEEISWR